MALRIRSSRLTTCGVAADGKNIELEFIDDDARYVFGLREWSLESARDQACLIATLKTLDGFEVSFGIPFEACRSLGWSLQQGANQAVAASEAHEETLGPCAIKLN